MQYGLLPEEQRREIYDKIVNGLPRATKRQLTDEPEALFACVDRTLVDHVVDIPKDPEGFISELQRGITDGMQRSVLMLPDYTPYATGLEIANNVKAMQWDS